MKAPYGWGWGGPHRHEEQNIKGLVENKPLPVNCNEKKVASHPHGELVLGHRYRAQGSLSRASGEATWSFF